MAISQTRYVLITSGVGGAASVANRELIARLMTTNVLVPTNGVLEFGGGASAELKNVGIHFGTESQEYKFAQKYFGYVSKDIKQPTKISFARYTPTAVAPQLISTEAPALLTAFTAVSDGSIKLTLGGVTTELTGIDLSSATNYADVASALQTAVRAYTTGGGNWTSATVTYADGKFTLTGGVTGSADITAASAASAGTDISGMLGWSEGKNPVVSVGCDAETITAALDRIANTSNNFGSFCFVEALTTENITEAATWANAQNVRYVFSQAVTSSNYSTIQAAVAGMDGVCLTLSQGQSIDNAQFMPMAIGAAIDYTRSNASTNFMYHQFGSETPTVTTDAQADTYDAVKVNYLGATQQAGNQIAFYQRGTLQGDISDIGVFYNEMWLKDAIFTACMNLLLAVRQLPANSDGAATARGVLSEVITQAKNNGVILAGKTLTSAQKAYITSLTNNDGAWVEVQTNGYWLNAEIKSRTVNNVTEYYVDYMLIYGKGDSIRKIEGSDILI